MKQLPALLLVAVFLGGTSRLRADESVLGFVRGAETLPHARADAIQTITFRTGASRGSYDAVDSTTEAEYGATDRLQLGVSVGSNYVHSHEVKERPDQDDYRFGGGSVVAKYRLLSPFKDPIGLALRVEAGYLMHSKVSGSLEHERFLAPELIFQKNFLDDTFITALNVGAEWDWGRQPAVNHPRDFALTGGLGVSYRFVSNWFFGVDSSVRSAWPQFDVQDFEHVAVYLGPSLHYGAERWWATLSWAWQVFGTGADEPHHGQSFAEDVRHQIRLKIGFNF